jgi:type IV secretory pathway component VirB8
MQNSLASDILKLAKKKATFWKIATIVVIIVAIAEFLIIMN